MSQSHNVTTPHTPVTPPIHLIPVTSAAHAGWGEVSHQMVFVQQLRWCNFVSIWTAATQHSSPPYEQSAAAVGEVHIRPERESPWSMWRSSRRSMDDSTVAAKWCGTATVALPCPIYGSLSEAFYQALIDEGSNPNLLMSLKRGLEVRLLHHRTPPDVIRFLIHYHNGFHAGSGTSFCELVAMVPDVTRMQAIHT